MTYTARDPSAIIPFSFENHAVRVIDRDGQIWFVATDIAEALEYREGKDLTRILDEDEKGRHIVPTLGGDQQLNTINESGLYHAILKSRKPAAKRFRRWVTAEVLPALRKTGRYESGHRAPSEHDLNRLAWEMCHAMWHEMKRALMHQFETTGEITNARVLVSCDTRGHGTAMALHPMDMLISVEQYESVAEGLALQMAATRALEHAFNQSNMALSARNVQPADAVQWVDIKHTRPTVRPCELSISGHEV